MKQCTTEQAISFDHSLSEAKRFVPFLAVFLVLWIEAADLRHRLGRFEVFVVAEVDGGVMDRPAAAEEVERVAAAELRAVPARREQPADEVVLIGIGRDRGGDGFE